VVPGSAAAAAALRAGDVIRSIGAVPVERASDVVQTVRRLRPGSTVPLVIVRNGSEETISVTVGAPPSEDDPTVRTLYQTIEIAGTLRRTLLDVPKTLAPRRPGVLLIGGIGCFSVDVASNPEDGYLRISRDLARAGFITMRLEKSGVGDSQGPPCHDVEFHDESAGYAVALEALSRDPRVDPAHLYLLDIASARLSHRGSRSSGPWPASSFPRRSAETGSSTNCKTCGASSSSGAMRRTS
jgi:hypothetical protein